LNTHYPESAKPGPSFKKYTSRLDSLAERILSGKNRSEVLMATSGLSQAHTAYRKALLNYRRTFFWAPFSGVIGNLNIKENEYVTAGEAIAMLYDLSKIKLEVSVLENEAPLVLTGAKCTARFPALNGRSVTGKVYEKNTVLNKEQHTLRVGILLQDGAQGILPGMSAEVEITARAYEETLLVPKEAVLERDERNLVFVVRDSVANWCYITPGKRNNRYVQVLDSEFNLKAGEPVIIDGHFNLAHGAKVQPE
ncbi:MAG: efflux RND transporter periplasmic adaptor subunit, partial [Caldithrix sp.]|nr:efflux RND transporter periplasmic adaptor subunit [Caldithrix sp.]